MLVYWLFYTQEKFSGVAGSVLYLTIGIAQQINPETV